MKIKPMHDRVIISLIENESVTAGGLIIPDSAKEKPQKGKVISCGGGSEAEPMQVKVGDTVLFSKYAGTEVDVDGEKCLLMRESDIFCTI